MKKLLITLMVLTAVNTFADDFTAVTFKAESGSHIAKISQSSAFTKVEFDNTVGKQMPLIFSYENNRLEPFNFRLIQSNPYTFLIDYKPNKIAVTFNRNNNDYDKYIVNIDNTQTHTFYAGTFLYINNFIVKDNKFTATTSRTVGAHDDSYLPAGTAISGMCNHGQAQISKIGNNDFTNQKIAVALSNGDGSNTNCTSGNGEPKNILLVDDLKLKL